MPDGLVPAEKYKMGEGNSHMKTYFAYFWILDKSRGDQRRTNVREDQTQYNNFRQLTEILRERIWRGEQEDYRGGSH